MVTGAAAAAACGAVTGGRDDAAVPAAQPGASGQLPEHRRQPGLADVLGLVVANDAAAQDIGPPSRAALRGVNKAVSQAYHSGQASLEIVVEKVRKGAAGAAELARFLRRRALPLKLSVLAPSGPCAPEHV